MQSVTIAAGFTLLTTVMVLLMMMSIIVIVNIICLSRLKESRLLLGAVF